MGKCKPVYPVSDLHPVTDKKTKPLEMRIILSPDHDTLLTEDGVEPMEVRFSNLLLTVSEVLLKYKMKY